MCAPKTLNGRKPTLKGLRTRYGLSQQAEAEKLYESPNMMSKVENGIKKPSMSLRARIANLYQVHRGDILYSPDEDLPKKRIDFSSEFNDKERYTPVKADKDDKTRAKDRKELEKLSTTRTAREIDPKRQIIAFTINKPTFIHEISVIREAPIYLFTPFVQAFSVLCSPDYDWETLRAISGLSRSAILNNRSKRRGRNILVEFPLRTVLRLAYVPFQDVRIRKHFKYNIKPENVDEAIHKSLNKYNIRLKDVNKKIKLALSNRNNTEEISKRMGVSVATINNYRNNGFNVLAMTFREVVVLLNCYHRCQQRKMKKNNKVDTMTVPSGNKYHCVNDNNGNTFILVPLTKVLDVDKALGH